MEDSRIIQLFFQRDEEAIEEVSRKYSAYCSKIVWNVLYNKEDCDECLNDVWFTPVSYTHLDVYKRQLPTPYQVGRKHILIDTLFIMVRLIRFVVTLIKC